MGLFGLIWGGKCAVVSTCRQHTLLFSTASAKQKQHLGKAFCFFSPLTHEMFPWTSERAAELAASHMTLVSRAETVSIQRRAASDYFERVVFIRESTFLSHYGVI